MIELLKAEFFKLRKSKGLLICGIIMAAYVVVFSLINILVINALGNLIGSDEGQGVLELMRASGFNASSSLSFFANDLMVLLILTTVVICGFYANDYKSGLLRNTLTSGQSRTKIYLSKLIMVFFITSAVFLFVVVYYMALYGAIGGWDNSDARVSAGKFIGFFFLEWLLFLATSCLVFMFSTLTKNTGATIGITIGLAFAFNILSTFGIASGPMGGGYVEPSETPVFVKVIDEISRLFSGSQITLSAGLSQTGWRLAEAIIVGFVTLFGSVGIGLLAFCRQDQK